MIYILINPGVAVSTGAIFKAFDAVPDIRETLRPMKASGDLLARALDGRNGKNVWFWRDVFRDI